MSLLWDSVALMCMTKGDQKLDTEDSYWRDFRGFEWFSQAVWIQRGFGGSL